MTDQKYTELLGRELRVLVDDVVASPESLTRILAGSKRRPFLRRAAPLISAAAVVLVAAGLWVAVARGDAASDPLPQASAPQVGACVAVPGPVDIPVGSGVLVTRDSGGRHSVCVVSSSAEVSGRWRVTPNAPYSVSWLSHDANGFVVAGRSAPEVSRVELFRANTIVTSATTVGGTFAIRADSVPVTERPTGMILKIYGHSGTELYSGPVTTDLAQPPTHWHPSGP